jgi:hypothetical protein
MRVRLGMLACAALFAARAVAGEAGPVTLAHQEGSWEMAYGDVYYRVVGKVENRSKKPVKAVKLKLELLDAGGKPVVERVGYNQKAEVLGGVDGYDTGGSDEQKLAKVEPIPSGGDDLFRLGVGKNEIPKKPKFKSFRVSIVEVKQ